MTLLSELFPQAALAPDLGSRAVAGLTADSRAVRAGYVFVAVPGTKTDGALFVPQALAKGAIAVVAEQPIDLPAEVAFVRVADARAALALAAAVLHPRQPETIVAVTGTSGKTSVAAFVREIWLELGHSAASLGTIGVVAPSGAVYGSLTTPDPVTLHATLDRLAGDGVTHLAMEASSHGLDQRRLDGVRLTAGAFTNLSRDHLDYHPNLDAYLAAKLRLFDTLLRPGQTAVVDADSSVAAKVVAACRQRGLGVLTTGEQGDDIRLLAADRDGLATRLTIRQGGGEHSVVLPLLGRFQVANALVAAGLCIATGGEPARVFAALGSLEGAPGRLELVGNKNGAPVFVDYAHKPDGLEKVLQVLRPLTQARLIVVFGAGGDRDPGKRPMMGEIAVANADVVIVTDDNPRSEDPAVIRAAILAAAPGAIEIGDRGKAITEAVAQLGPGDVLLVAGKGHETGQIVGDTVLPFSDHAAVRAALRDLAS
jgi:UDP-N-acetylmuramoyl-L-alanyl-D-glutamate--2,6-diaminopimelate ligase